MQGTLDLSAHRLDAWVTSVATRRLAAMRRRHPGGPVRRRLRLGRESRARCRRVDRHARHHAAAGRGRAAADAGERQRLHPRAVDDACRHRRAAAQRAPRADRRAAAPPGRSRSTCRRAGCARPTRLLEGLRQGQPLGALLGYRVERLLHDTRVDNGRSLDRFIAPLRRVAPLVARERADTRRTRRHHRRQQRRRRPGPAIAAGRRSAAPSLAEVTTAGTRHERPVGALSSILDRSATPSTA